MNVISKTIWVTFQKEGMHKYPEALTDPALATGDDMDVSFLGYPHRHIFHFRVEVNVEGSNRDIEFIQFKRKLEKLYDTKTLQLENQSCEMMAEDLIEAVRKEYPTLTEIFVTVSEDGENGATVQYRNVPDIGNYVDSIEYYSTTDTQYSFNFNQ